jgi:hypothetical protein
MQKWHSSTRKQCRTCHRACYLIVRGALSLPPRPPRSFKHELPGIASRRVKITLSHATPCVSASRVKRTYASRGGTGILDASRDLSSSIGITGPGPIGTIVDTWSGFIVLVDSTEKRRIKKARVALSMFSCASDSVAARLQSHRAISRSPAERFYNVATVLLADCK